MLRARTLDACIEECREHEGRDELDYRECIRRCYEAAGLELLYKLWERERDKQLYTMCMKRCMDEDNDYETCVMRCV